MFIAALFTTTKQWKQAKCSSVIECTNQLWDERSMEYYSALKRDEILIYATIRVKH